jgi:hypothetical protein
MRIALALDNDQGGQEGTRRALQMNHDLFTVPFTIGQILINKNIAILDAEPFLHDWLIGMGVENANYYLFSLGGAWRRKALTASLSTLANTQNRLMLLYLESLDNGEPSWYCERLWQKANTIQAEINRRSQHPQTNPPSRFKAIKDKNDLVEVISQNVTLKKRGKSWTGRCPFHDDSTPSLSVSETKQLWHCFSCLKGGDVITWLQLMGRL